MHHHVIVKRKRCGGRHCVDWLGLLSAPLFNKASLVSDRCLTNMAPSQSDSEIDCLCRPSLHHRFDFPCLSGRKMHHPTRHSMAHYNATLRRIYEGFLLLKIDMETCTNSLMHFRTCARSADLIKFVKRLALGLKVCLYWLTQLTPQNGTPKGKRARQQRL